MPRVDLTTVTSKTLWPFVVASILSLSSASSSAEAFSKWMNVEQEIFDQFSHSSVTHLHQSSNGKVWIATEEALFLHDGNTITQYKVPLTSYPHIPASRYVEIFELLGKTILVTKDDGFFTLDLGADEFTRFEIDGLDSNLRSISKLALAQENSFSLLLANNDLYVVDYISQKSHLVSTSGDSKAPVVAVIGHDAHFYIVLKNGEVRTINPSSTFNFSPQLELCATGSKHEIVAANIFGNDLILFEKSLQDRSIKVSDHSCGDSRIETRFKSVTNRSKIKFAKPLPQSNALALVTGEGLYIHKNDVNTLISSANTNLGSNDVLTVSEVAPNSILVGGFLGLAQIEYSGMVVVDHTDLEDEPEFTALAGGQSDDVFVASTEALYLLRLKNEWVELNTVADFGNKAGITALHYWDNTLWIGLADGDVLVLDAENEIQKCAAPSRLIDGAPITSFSTSTSDSRMKITTLSGQIVSFSNCTTAVVARIDGGTIPQAPLIRISSLDQQTNWIFNFDGAYKLLHAPSSSSSDVVGFDYYVSHFLPRFWGLRSHSSETFFYSPTGALNKLDQDSNQIDRVEAGRNIGEPIYSMEFDASGRFWLAGKSGLWIARDADQSPILWRSPRSRRRPIVFDYGVSHRTRNGALLFGGANGLVVVTNAEKMPDLRPSPIWISQARINNSHSFFDRETSTDVIVLSASSSNISFEVSYDHIKRPRESAIDLYLEGFDSSWQSSLSGNSAKYYNLPPGKYTFRARGAGPEGVWSENEISLPIIVKPPFWKTYWAYAVYCLLLLWAVRLVKQYNDHRVVQADRLAHARETEVAFNRLEDAAQLHRDLAHRQLKHRKTHSLVVLDIVAQIKQSLSVDGDVAHNDNADALDGYLAALSCAEALADRSMSGDSLDLASFANEHFSLLASRDQSRSGIIFINDVAEQPFPLSTALQIVPVVQEALEFSVESFAPPSRTPPTLHIFLSVAAPGDNGSSELRLSAVADPTIDVSESELSSGFPVTYHLIESLGGRIEHQWATKLSLDIRLSLPPVATESGA